MGEAGSRARVAGGQAGEGYGGRRPSSESMGGRGGGGRCRRKAVLRPVRGGWNANNNL